MTTPSGSTSARAVIYKLQSDKWVPIHNEISDINVTRDPDRVYVVAPNSAVLLDLPISKHFEYVKATVCFHQFAESNSIYGLNFASEEDATRFADFVSNVMKRKKKKTSKKKKSTTKKKSTSQKNKDDDIKTSSYAEEDSSQQVEEEEEVVNEPNILSSRPKHPPPAPPPKKSLPPLPPKKSTISPPSPKSNPIPVVSKSNISQVNTSEGEKLPPELENLKKEIFNYIDQIKNEILESLRK